MTTVAWKDIRVRVRIAAPNQETLDAAFADIERAVKLAASRKVLRARYHLLAHDVYGTQLIRLTQHQVEETYGQAE